MMSDDQQLVRLTLKKPEAFESIVLKYEQRIDSYLKGIIHASKEDREDISQEIFLAVYRYLNSYKPAYAFSTWLFSIAHNKAMTFLRKHRTRYDVEIVNTTKEEEDFLDNTVSDEDVEKNVEQLIHLEQVKSKMHELSVQDREVLLLRYCEQKEYSEISAILRLPEGTVAAILHRAKIKLKKLLSQHDSIK